MAPTSLTEEPEWEQIIFMRLCPLLCHGWSVGYRVWDVICGMSDVVTTKAHATLPPAATWGVLGRDFHSGKTDSFKEISRWARVKQSWSLLKIEIETLMGQQTMPGSTGVDFLKRIHTSSPLVVTVEDSGRLWNFIIQWVSGWVFSSHTVNEDTQKQILNKVNVKPNSTAHLW